MRLASFLALIGALLLLAPIGTSGAQDGVICGTAESKGAAVDTIERCRVFRHFEADNKPADARIAKRLQLQPGQSARSIALIVAIGKYDNAAYNTPAADIDADNLERFLIDDQHFDEVIVLKDADATVANIRYFLRAYALARAAFYDGKVRFLFAYSGHGVQTPAADAGDTPGVAKPLVGMALAAAYDANDTDHIYSMAELRGLLSDLSRNDYQVLALINACYGGDLFGVANADNDYNDSYDRGADAITAGPNDRTVLSLGEGHGSLFFDTLIEGIRNGQADPPARDVTLGVAKLPREIAGIVRLGEIDSYLDTQMLVALDNHPQESEDLQGNTHHRLGTVAALDIHAAGGFFFVWNPPKPAARPSDLLAFNAALTFTTDFSPSLNQLLGKPAEIHDNLADLRSAHGTVQGIDVSHLDGPIDWALVAKAGIRFTYMKATQSTQFVDPKFAANWAGAASAGIPRGAFHVFSFCATPQDQANLIFRTLGDYAGALPIGLDVELYDGQAGSSIAFLQKEGECAATLGPSSIRKNLKALADLLQQKYGQVPILYGNDSLLDHVLTADFTRNYPLWRERYNVVSGPPVPPWSIWQYTSNASIPGIGRKVDMDVLSAPESARLGMNKPKP